MTRFPEPVNAEFDLNDGFDSLWIRECCQENVCLGIFRCRKARRDIMCPVAARSAIPRASSQVQ